MANLSITEAWNQTVAFVKREAQLLFPLAFMLVALPVALLEAVTPAPPAPGELPPAGLWLVLVPVVIVASVVGNIAISFLALRPGASVGEAIGRGARRFLPLVSAGILLALAGGVIFFILAMIAVMLVPGAMSAAQGGAPSPELAMAVLIVILLLVPLLIWLGARLMLMTPLAAAEDVGPIGLMRRSWALTAGHTWKLVAFLILVGLAAGILSGAIEMVVGVLAALLAGTIEPGSLGALLVILVMAAVTTVLTVYLTSLVARIYAQLSGMGSENVFA